ncbi:transcriptional regulator [candidate division KSB1 bacterium]|nr:transcriptional regulator [candidate division KSB1 bacterium]
MKPDQILHLDPLVHAPIRLGILSILITVEHAQFTFLKESIGTTDGNLSTHLSKLEEAGLIRIEKTFIGKKPHTLCAITDKGRKAFQSYIEQLDRIVKAQKIQ